MDKVGKMQKMRINIQYIWIKNWRYFCNTEVNFSQKYNIHYDQEKRVIDVTDKSSTFVKDLYGKNLDLSVIIGGNSVGKTSLFHFLLSFSEGTAPNLEGIGDYIIAVENLDSHQIMIESYSDNDGLIDEKCIASLKANGIDVSIVSKDQNRYNRFMKSEWNSMFVYYSGYLGNPMEEYHGQRLLTPDYNLYLAMEESQLPREVLRRYYSSLFEKQLVFVSEKRKFLEESFEDIRWPHKVFITASQEVNTTRWLKEREKESGKKEEQIELVTQIFRQTTSDNSFVVNMGREVIYALMVYEKTFDWVEKNRDKTVCENGEIVDFLIDAVDYISDKGNASLLKSLINFLTVTKRVLKSKLLTFTDNRMVFSLVDSRNKINMQSFISFFSSYQLINGLAGFLSFDWRLSSGEMSLLNEFSQLYSLTGKTEKEQRYFRDDTGVNKKMENVIVLLDEAEVSFHPEWQRKYVKLLVSFLENVYKGTHVQVLMATHSPLILSDVPKQSTVFLKWDEENNRVISDSRFNHSETFGTNIYRLYNDAFFLDRYMGEFVISKIEEELGKKGEGKKKASGKRKKTSEIIDLIGDPLLKDEIKRVLEKQEGDYCC